METLGLENVLEITNNQQEELSQARRELEKPVVVKELSTDTMHAVFIGGKVDTTTHAKQPPRRGHVVQTINDFALAVDRWGDAELSSLWVDSNGVTLVIDDTHRLDRVRLPAATSEGYTLVTGFREAKVLSQLEFVALLRTKLVGYVVEPGLLGLIRRLKWSNSDAGHSVVNSGSASLGQSVEKQLSGLENEELPESFTVQVPIWQAPLNEFREKIRVDITIDFGSQKFRLEVSKDSIAEALLSAQLRLKTAVVEKLSAKFKPLILLGSV
jgi:hypothetical protein